MKGYWKPATLQLCLHAAGYLAYDASGSARTSCVYVESLIIR